MERVAVVDEGLKSWLADRRLSADKKARVTWYHEKRPCRIVEKDCGCENEHG